MIGRNKLNADTYSLLANFPLPCWISLFLVLRQVGITDDFDYLELPAVVPLTVTEGDL